MTFNILTTTLNNFIATFSGGYGRMSGAVNGLLTVLGGIDLVLLGFWWALGGGEQLVAVFKKLLYLGFWIWAVRSFPSLAQSFVESLMAAGTLAGGGGSTNILLDPSAIAGHGLDATLPIVKKIADMGLSDISDIILFEAVLFMLLICFFVMAINCFLAVLEYYLIVALVGIFLPFALLPSTKFLAEKAIGAVSAVGVKLMTLAFIMAVIDPTLASMQLGGPDVTINDILSMLLTVAGCTFLAWQAPRLASGLMSGSPSLGAGDAAQGATSLGGLAAMPTLVAASFGATRAAALAGGQGRGAATQSASAALSTVSGKANTGTGSVLAATAALGANAAESIGSGASAVAPAGLEVSAAVAVGKGNSPPPLNGEVASLGSSAHRSLVKSVLRGPTPLQAQLFATKLLVS